MSRILNDFQKSQYEKFRSEMLSEWGMDEQRFSSLESKLKPIHKKQLSLACIATVVGQRAKRNVYAEGIVESSHLALVMSVKGLENPSCVLQRQIIELTLKHIYFSTHPVEYSWANTRVAYKELSFPILIEYLKKTDECRRLARKYEGCKKIEKWYSDLCRHVHVQSKGFMGYKRMSSGYNVDDEIIRRMNQSTKELWPILIVFLIIFFPHKYTHASEIEKKLIRSAISEKLRKCLDEFLRDFQ